MTLAAHCQAFLHVVNLDDSTVLTHLHYLVLRVDELDVGNGHANGITLWVRLVGKHTRHRSHERIALLL